MSSMFDLKGQVALVTGATRGIGQSMALALAEAGSDLVLLQRTLNETKTQDAIRALGRQAHVYEADLSSNKSLKEAIAHILQTEKHDISILVNCAGIQIRHPSAEFPDEDWAKVVQINLNAVFVLCRDVGAHMLQRKVDAGQRRGSMINIASLLSFQGGITVPAYAAAKGGVVQLTKALSNEWASQGINVNAIAPGYVNTEMNTALLQDSNRRDTISQRIPAGRWGTPDDFRGPVVFLASRASGYVSGEVLTVDGDWMGR